jgi:hypothetical protein
MFDAAKLPGSHRGHAERIHRLRPMRDDFSAPTKELLAKRVGVHCSNPECQRATSGPQEDPHGAVNIGVAAHISAASFGGPRFDADLSSEQRCDSSNGIWLCQNCAKLIDNDPIRFDRAVLEGWKRAAERAAALDLAQGRHRGARPQSSPSAVETPLDKVERLMPALLEEMREDLLTNPTTREFLVYKKGLTYNSGGAPFLVYFLDGHEDLPGKLHILENYGFIREVRRDTHLQKFRFEEEFIDYLAGSA